ncbi:MULTISPECIES: hypothetical protein [unclassified Microcoleus]|uniref:hypothetical protein n=1 Tax=unclassified Microcoleus TaxID=2642155 RepID=UPI002FD4ADB2
MHCTLGLDCTQMGLDEGGECINEESCYRYTEAGNLYEIVLLKGFPGAVYLCWHSKDNANTEWTDEKWGFKHLNNWGASHICKNTSSDSFLLPSDSFLLAPDS